MLFGEMPHQYNWESEIEVPGSSTRLLLIILLLLISSEVNTKSTDLIVLIPGYVIMLFKAVGDARCCVVIGKQ